MSQHFLLIVCAVTLLNVSVANSQERDAMDEIVESELQPTTDSQQALNNELLAILEKMATQPAHEVADKFLADVLKASESQDADALDKIGIVFYSASSTDLGQRFFQQLDGRRYALVVGSILKIMAHSRHPEARLGTGTFVGTLTRYWLTSQEKKTANGYRKYLVLVRALSILLPDDRMILFNRSLSAGSSRKPLAEVEAFHVEGFRLLAQENLLADVTRAEWEGVRSVLNLEGIRVPIQDPSGFRASVGLEAVDAALASVKVRDVSDLNPDLRIDDAPSRPKLAVDQMIQSEMTNIMALILTKPKDTAAFEIRSTIRGRDSNRKHLERDTFVAGLAKALETEEGQQFLSRLTAEQFIDLLNRSTEAAAKASLKEEKQIQKRLLLAFVTNFSNDRTTPDLNQFRKYLAIMNVVAKNSSRSNLIDTSDSMLGTQVRRGKPTITYLQMGFDFIAASDVPLTYAEREALTTITNRHRDEFPESMKAKMPLTRFGEFRMLVKRKIENVLSLFPAIRTKREPPAINSCHGVFSPL